MTPGHSSLDELQGVPQQGIVGRFCRPYGMTTKANCLLRLYVYPHDGGDDNRGIEQRSGHAEREEEPVASQ